MKKDLIGWLLGENEWSFGNWAEVPEPDMEYHDCHKSPEDGCEGCPLVRTGEDE